MNSSKASCSNHQDMEVDINTRERASQEDVISSKRTKLNMNRSEAYCSNHQDMEVDINTRKRATQEDMVSSKRIKPDPYPAAGLKNFLHGNSYQLKLLMLFLKRGLYKGYSFRLATEWVDAEKFDDLVFRYENGKQNGKVYLFLQAKHKVDESKKISKTDLFQGSDKQNREFSLQIYFMSYRKIKQNPIFNRENTELKDFVICTNIDLDKNLHKHFKQIENVNDILRTDVHSQKQPKYLKLKADNESFTDNLYSKLKYSTDLFKLAEILAECLIDGKCVSCDKSKQDKDDNLFISYQVPLAYEVIDTKTHTLRDGFLKNQGLSPQAQHLREAFEEVFNERRKLFNFDNRDYNILVKNLEQFCEGLCTLISDAKANKEITIKKRTKNLSKIIEDDFDKLAGYVLIKTNDTIKFSSRFLSNDTLPGNLNAFRDKLKNKLCTDILNELDQYKFHVYKDFETCEEIYVNKDALWRELANREIKLFHKLFGQIDTNLDPIENFVKEFTKLLLHNYSKHEIKVSRSKIKMDIDKLAPYVLVKCDDQVQFASEFLNPDHPLPGNVDRFRDELKKALAANFDFEKLSEYRFCIENFPNTSLPNDSISSINADIESFFNKLVFAVNQPNELELGDIIKQELGDEFNFIDSELIYSQFQTKMLDWMKEEEGRFLSPKEGNEFFNKTKQMLNNFKLSGISLDYRAKLRNLTFNDAQEYLKSFLRSTEKQIFNLINPQETMLSSIKVYQNLKKIPSYEKDDSYIFMDLESLLNMEDLVVETDCLLLVVECNTTENIGPDVCSRFTKIITCFIKGNSKKKVILITNTNRQALVKSFKKNYEYEERCDEEINFDDLTDDSQNEILETGIVIFQGKELSLGALIDDKSKQLIYAEALSELIVSKKVNIGRALPNTERNWVDRTIIPMLVVAPLLGYDPHFLVIRGNNSRNIDQINLEKSKAIILISDDENDFINLCTHFKERNIYWLEDESRFTLLKQIHGSLSIFRSYAYYYFSYNEPSMINVLEQRIFILSAEPGMGKSTVLTKKAEELKELDPALWISKINLIDHQDHIKKFKIDVNSNKEQQEQEVLELLLDVMGLDNRLEKALFEYNFRNQGRIALLFDGFDEISPTYKEKVIGLLQVLKHAKIQKLWVTTRPEFKNDVEDVLGTLACKLEDLTQYYQIELLGKIWRKNLGYETLDKERFELYIKNLLQLFTKSINGGSRFLALPLHITMLGEAYQDNFKEFYESERDFPNLPEKLDSLSLYERFIEIKFDIFCKEKRKDYVENACAIRGNKQLFEIYKREHKLLALHTLFFDDQLNTILTEDEKQEVIKLKGEVKDGSEKCGIFYLNSQGKVHFIHRTFAEYFAAAWLVDKLEKQEVKDFVRHKIFVKDDTILLHFFEHLLAKKVSKNNACELHTATLNQDINKIEELLKNVHIIDIQDKAGRTELHLAAIYGYGDIIDILLNHKADLNIVDVFNCKPIEYTIKNEQWGIVESLLNKFANCDNAAKEAYVHLVKLLEGALDDNYAREELLVLAVRKGYINIVGVCFEIISTPYIGQLIAVNSKGKTLLHLAAEKGHLEIVKYLVEKGTANLNAVDKFGQTPLHFAVRNNHLDIVRYLANKHETNINSSNMNGATPLYFAATLDHFNVAKFLIDKGADVGVSVNPISFLHVVVKNGWTDLVKFLLDHRNINCETEDGDKRTLLHLATEYINRDLVRYLVNEKNANINSRDKDGFTPLFSATGLGRLDVAKFLIEKGADVGVSAKNKKTPLHLAVEHNNLELVKYLVSERNSSTDSFDIDGSTPLYSAAKLHNFNVAEFLIEKGADVGVSVEGNCFLHVVVKNRWTDLAKILIEEKDINCETQDGNKKTPLHLAAEHNNLELVKYLVSERNSCIDSFDINGFTPLFSAAKLGRLDVVKFLIDKGADVSVLVKCDRFLHVVVVKGWTDLAKFLIDKEVFNCESQDEDERTPLHLAAAYDRLEIFEYLVKEKNANLYAKDKYGKTPSDYANSDPLVLKYTVPGTRCKIASYESEYEYRAKL